MTPHIIIRLFMLGTVCITLHNFWLLFFRSQSRRNNEESSDSSTDESLVSSKDLKAARKDAKYWRMQCRREREHNASLEKRIEFLEKHIEKRLDSGKNLFFCQLYMLSDNTHAFLVLQILQRQKPCEGHNGK